jgi:hypothetical protein
MIDKRRRQLCDNTIRGFDHCLIKKTIDWGNTSPEISSRRNAGTRTHRRWDRGCSIPAEVRVGEYIVLSLPHDSADKKQCRPGAAFYPLACCALGQAKVTVVRGASGIVERVEQARGRQGCGRAGAAVISEFTDK